MPDVLPSSPQKANLTRNQRMHQLAHAVAPDRAHAFMDVHTCDCCARSTYVLLPVG